MTFQLDELSMGELEAQQAVQLPDRELMQSTTTVSAELTITIESDAGEVQSV
ncbi:MAG TPA: hypothetical protein VK975_06735 [Acidimicrobiales bacterium]|nr:hypothetical protein [Acidimicrobiales bacterium]